ncbi:GerAB/ArcD/ProY family transporter [Cohnella luojiensis]|uniref:Spore gernimation protein n=1 Tax=Cohnella luojiensis TaxID=652876 RepID=A0A4Y8LSW7_9BACL|nr:endospore germination permease [Cohnella luojiensis]TFE23460.1 spore gernimation protein [Cohnella luojiensis]
MLEKGKIAGRQFMILVIFYIMGSAILFIPGKLSAPGKQDSWISALVATGVGLLIVLIYNVIGRRNPGMTIVEYSEHVLGKWFGKIVALVFLIFFLILIALDLRDIGDFLSTQAMPDTPIQAVLIPFLCVVMIGMRYGLEVYTRFAELFFPVVLLLWFILLISLYPEMKFEHIQPIFEHGFKGIAITAPVMVGFPMSELVALLMIYPYVNQKKSAAKGFLVGTLIGGIMLTLLTLVCILVLGVFGTVSSTYPSYLLAQKINIGDFFQRVEALMAIIWFFTLFTRVSIFFYAIVLGLAQVMKLQDYRPLILPLGLFLLSFGQTVSPNIIHVIGATKNEWAMYQMTCGVFFPLLLLGADTLRQNRGRKL